MSKKPTTQEKFKTVISKNTFFFYSPQFEESYEGHIISLQQTLLSLKSQMEKAPLQKREILEEFLLNKKEGLTAVLSLTGISNETLKRLITLIRIVDDEELSKAVYKKEWLTADESNNLKEWSNEKIATMIKTNPHFRKGLVNILYDGASIEFLSKVLPLFELKKLMSLKFEFKLETMIDTLIRYSQKGSYSGIAGNNAEIIIEGVLKKKKIPFSQGDLKHLVEHDSNKKRTMDFIIPDKDNPKIIIESSFLTTTSSGQGDKSKTEINVKELLKEHYPKALFIGFIDGIGWYVRKNDLQRMVSAYHDVFTFHKDEMLRFEALVQKTL